VDLPSSLGALRMNYPRLSICGFPTEITRFLCVS
jgi:hypothetical protein